MHLILYYYITIVVNVWDTHIALMDLTWLGLLKAGSSRLRPSFPYVDVYVLCMVYVVDDGTKYVHNVYYTIDKRKRARLLKASLPRSYVLEASIKKCEACR